MSEQSLILEAVKIMVVGMTTVFSFLVFMILFLKVQGGFLTRFFPQKAAAKGAVKPQGETLNKIILEAIREYRRKQH